MLRSAQLLLLLRPGAGLLQAPVRRRGQGRPVHVLGKDNGLVHGQAVGVAAATAHASAAGRERDIDGREPQRAAGPFRGEAHSVEVVGDDGQEAWPQQVTAGRPALIA